MPPLDTVEIEPPDANIAVMAEVLYLCNLLLVPGIAFLMLVYLYYKHKASASSLSRCHLQQTLVASLWAGVLIIVVNAAILIFGGYDQPWTWVLLIIYFTTLHATLVLLGVVGLSKALAAKHYHYPLIGPRCQQETGL